MTDEDAFRAAIVAAPADDTPRLVFADWLDEHAAAMVCQSCDGVGWTADPNTGGTFGKFPTCLKCEGRRTTPDATHSRAEFIRVQIALHQTGCGEVHPDLLKRTDKVGELARRQRQLWKSPSGNQWWGDDVYPTLGRSLFELPRAGQTRPAGLVRRGFVHAVRGPLGAFWTDRACAACVHVSSFSRLRACACGGTGRVGGPTAAFQTLCRREPVERVGVTDKTPDAEGDAVAFRFTDRDQRQWYLPAGLLTRIPQDRQKGWVRHYYDPDRTCWTNVWLEAEDAETALSDALLRLAREGDTPKTA